MTNQESKPGWEDLSESWEEAEKQITKVEHQLIDYAEDIWDRDWLVKSGEKRAFVNLFRSIMRQTISQELEKEREEIIKILLNGKKVLTKPSYTLPQIQENKREWSRYTAWQIALDQAINLIRKRNGV